MDEDGTPSTSEERCAQLKQYVEDTFTSRGIAVQATGKRCFTLQLPQSNQDFDELVSGVVERGGAIDLTLGTDAMKCTVWESGKPSRKRMPPVRKKGTQWSMFVLAILVAMAGFILLSLSK